MKLSPFIAVSALTLMFVAGFGLGRFSKPTDNVSVEPRAINSTWRPLEIFNSPEHSIRSDRAIEWLRIQHSEGKLIGERPEVVFEQIHLAKKTYIGSRFVEFSLHSTGGETHPTANIVIDLKTGLITDVAFGVLTW